MDDQESGSQSGSNRPSVATNAAHENHCFVVMPFGRTTEERKWFKGWYEVVIKPAIKSEGYEPMLAASEEQPGAINDEIRAHLAFDPMVVVDLGGLDADQDPNPNVMYELGIRHALGLPLVVMAWNGQTLPFDVSNQRVIMENRDMLDIATNQERLKTFIRSAAQGKYYKPMDAVGRHAKIDAAYASLGEESVLGALVHEVRDLRATVGAIVYPKRRTSRKAKVLTIKGLLGKKDLRKPLYKAFIDAGGPPKEWAKLLRVHPTDTFVKECAEWGEDEWSIFVLGEGRTRSRDAAKEPSVDDIPSSAPFTKPRITPSHFDEEFLQKVKAALPQQPWPKGVHKVVAQELGVPHDMVRGAIDHLIRRRDLNPQIDGVVYVPLEDNVTKEE
jgi:hypothetical protein